MRMLRTATPVAALVAAAVAVGILGMHALTPPDPGAAHHGVVAVAHTAAGGAHSPVDRPGVAAVDDGRSGHLLMLCGVMLAAAGLLLRPVRTGTGRSAGRHSPTPAPVRSPLRSQVGTARPPPVLAFSVVRC